MKDEDEDTERDATLGHVPHDSRADTPTDPEMPEECARLLDCLCDEWSDDGYRPTRRTALREVLRRAVHRTQWCRGDDDE